MQIPARTSKLSVPHALGFVCVLALVASVLIGALDSAVYDAKSDDGYYLHFMQVVSERGLSAFPDLFREWNGDKAHWIYPPPSRVAFVLTTAGWAKLFGASLQALSWLSLCSHLAWTTLNWFFARRRMGETFALLLAALTGFSPLLLGIGRLALTDSFTLLLLTASLWLFLELVETPRSRLWTILFGLSFAAVILTKELSVLAALPLALFVLIERFGRRTPLPLGRFALVLALPVLATGPVFVLAAGSVETLLTTTRIVLASPATNDYAIRYCAGPWYRYLIDYLCLSPFPTVIGILSLGALVARIQRGVWERALVYFAVVGSGLLFEHAFFIKNVRYMVSLELPLRILALAWICDTARGLSSKHASWIAAATVALLCWLDWRSFHTVWIDFHGYDPVSYFLLCVRSIVPWPGK